MHRTPPSKGQATKPVPELDHPYAQLNDELLGARRAMRFQELEKSARATKTPEWTRLAERALMTLATVRMRAAREIIGRRDATVCGRLETASAPYQRSDDDQPIAEQ